MQIVNSKVEVISDFDPDKAREIIQKAAKTCYQTNKDSDDRESAIRIIKALKESGHHSMFEFFNVTMHYTSNIATYKDLTRHRHCTFAVESSRYCSYDKDKFGNEIKCLKPVELKEGTPAYKEWLTACCYCEHCYMRMIENGATPDQASLVLPQSTAAQFTMSANLREWYHILSLRAVGVTGKPRPCVREIMIPTLNIFAEKLPEIFGDLKEKLKEEKWKCSL